MSESEATEAENANMADRQAKMAATSSNVIYIKKSKRKRKQKIQSDSENELRKSYESLKKEFECMKKINQKHLEEMNVLKEIIKNTRINKVTQGMYDDEMDAGQDTEDDCHQGEMFQEGENEVKRPSNPNNVDAEFPTLQEAGKNKGRSESVRAQKINEKSTAYKKVNVESKKKRMPPAFMVYNLNQKEAVRNLSEVIKHKNFALDIFNKNVTKISMSTMEDYNQTKNWLEASKAKFYTFTPSECKPYTFIINKLSQTYEEEEVINYLMELDMKLNIIKCMKWGKSKWMIQLGRETDINTFLNIKYVLNCKISLEKFQAKGPVQCKNCQRYNHVANNCRMPYRCVKCGESHGPNNCKIPCKEQNTQEFVIANSVSGEIIKRIGVPVKCINCGTEGHTANAKICPKRQEIIQRAQEKRQMAVRNANRASRPYQPVNERQSYASFLKTPLNVHNNAAPQAMAPQHMEQQGDNGIFGYIDDECKRLLGKNFAESLQKIGQFSKHYRTLTDDNSKSNAIFSLLLSLRLDD